MKHYFATLKTLTAVRIYLSSVTVVGIAVCLFSIYSLPVNQLDFYFWILAATTLLTGSRLTLKMPGKDIYFMLGDAFIFFVFLHYGAQPAILLAAAEALCSSLSYRKAHRKTMTNLVVAFNAAIMACSTGATYVAVLLYAKSSGKAVEFSGDTLDIFLTQLGMMVLVQFLINISLAAWAMALRKQISFGQAFYDHCLSGSITIIGGGAVAGLIFRLTQTSNFLGIGVVIAIGGAIYFTYRRHLENLATETTKREETEELFRHAALHDRLTDLPNRLSFSEKLQLALDEVKAGTGHGFCLLYLDINRFKTVNDLHGHHVGDILLRFVGRRLEKEVRKLPRANSHADLVARLGGDEFAVLISGSDNEKDAAGVAERIHERITSEFNAGGPRINTSTAIGIVIGSKRYDHAEDILRDADIAMYHAKDKSLPYAIFDQELGARAANVLKTDTGLRRALANNELRTFFQPIVELNSGQIVGFEALMRWQSPEQGLVPPINFIPQAEESGLIVPMTYWILRDSCEQLVKWQRLAPENSSLYVSVNLSIKHLTQPDLVEQIDCILKETGLAPEFLKLEITESGAMENPKTTIAVLNNIRALGVEISIDDFGTGYSSLSYLQEFPFDTLKIDRTFVKNIHEDSKSLSIVEIILMLAQKFKRKVIAEGIENVGQLELLRELGCGAAQGFLFSKPLPASEIESLMSRSSSWLPADVKPFFLSKSAVKLQFAEMVNEDAIGLDAETLIDHSSAVQ